MRRSSRAVGITTLLLLTAVACGGGGEQNDQAGGTPAAATDGTEAAGPQGEPIVIGAYASATGELQAFGSFMEQGFRIAEQHLNEDGGILGRPVEVRFQDDGSDKDQARSIVEAFVADEAVLAIIGPTSSANAFASHPVAVEAGVPVISVSNSAPGIVEQGETVHRAIMPDTALLPVMTKQLVSDLELQSVALLHAQDDPFSQATYDAFKTTLEELGVSISNDVAYTAATPDLSPQIRQLQQGDPQAVFVAAFAEDAGSFLRQARQNGLDVPVVGNASFNSPAQLEIAGDAAVGLVIGSQWWLDDPDELNQRFVEDSRAEFDRDPGTFGAIAYNGVYVAKAAIEASQDASREGVQEGLLSLDGYDVLGAPITFQNRDSTTDEPIILMADPDEPTRFIEYDPAALSS